MRCTAALVLAVALVAASAVGGALARTEDLQQLLGPQSDSSASLTSASLSSDGVLPKLKKAIVVDPLAGGDALEALQNIAKVLGKEPPAASEQGDGLEDEGSLGEDTMTMEDLALMGEDSSCDGVADGATCKKKSEASESSSSSSHSSDAASSSDSVSSSSGLSLLEEDEDKDTVAAEKAVDGAEMDLLQITSESRARGSHSGSSSGSHSSSHGGADDKISKTIRRLERQIRKAMLISKTIPDAVHKLEELKQQEEKMTEEHARQEATKTLDEHRRLMAEMTEHITKLRSKLTELVAKRAQLAASDARLRRELGQFAAGASSGSSGSSSSSSSGSQ